MGPVTVVVVDILVDHGFEMPTTEDQHPVEALTTHGASEALGEGVGPWRSDRGADDSDEVNWASRSRIKNFTG